MQEALEEAVYKVVEVVWQEAVRGALLEALQEVR